MGAKPSSLSDLQHNPVLQRLTGEYCVQEDKDFWEELLSFSFRPPYNSADARLLEESTQHICQSLANHNLKSKNFVLLVKEFIRRAAELKVEEKFKNFELVCELYNALLLIRSFCKYFIEVLPSKDIILHFGGSVTCSVDKETGKELISCTDLGMTEDMLYGLFTVLHDIPVCEETYAVHIETINTLLVLLSEQMFDIFASSNSIFYHAIMKGKCRHKAKYIVHVLLHNYVAQETSPLDLTTDNTAWFPSLWSWFGSPSSTEEDQSDSLLANQSLLLLLILVNHCTQDKRLLNPYRHSLFTFTDSKAVSHVGSDKTSDSSFQFNLERLYSTLCSDLQHDQTTLLLYLLLHRNPNVSSFVLPRKDIDQLVLPILELLYSAEDHNAHHIYMSLIILLILSQNDHFNKSVHEITIATIPWYTERAIYDITLGGLLVLVVLRTIQYNMTKMRDKYLHTNCLATLANMSSHFHALHPYVTQRIVSLYALLSKKHAKVLELMKEKPTKNTQATSENKDSTDYVADLAILEEVIRMVLEIINSCVTNTLHHNPNLVYTLLHRRELFAQFRSHPTFQDLIQNIDTVLAFFSARLEQHPDQTLSVAVVLDVIKQGTLQWPKDRLKKFPELKFKYVEEEQPEEFFIPYVWSLVYRLSLMYWNPQHIQIFHPET
ncbi:dymeclin-like isoform X2 [Actinia tenebrosa]|uniref:Dymeclin n=1 Tax=Actinia tenebrosa TaxID=6105 RepID=A0A6P8HXL3_ACTTE|nr:dymeclin-like isoform X2 [Actinia tenebrosa]